MKKLSTTKFHNFSRSTTFILVVFSNDVIGKAQKIQFQIISTSSFLNKPHVEIHDFYMRFLRKTACKNQFSLAVFLKNHL